MPFSSSLEPHSVQKTALGLAGASGAVLTGAGFSVTSASDASGVVLTGAALTGAGFTGWAGLSAAGFAAGTVRGRRYETLCIEQVAIHQEVSYRLVVVGVGSSDVGTDENTGLFRNRLLGKNSRRTENT